MNTCSLLLPSGFLLSLTLWKSLDGSLATVMATSHNTVSFICETVKPAIIVILVFIIPKMLIELGSNSTYPHRVEMNLERDSQSRVDSRIE